MIKNYLNVSFIKTLMFSIKSTATLSKIVRLTSHQVLILCDTLLQVINDDTSGEDPDKKFS